MQRGKRTSVSCEQCGVAFTPLLKDVARGQGRFCTKSCSATWSALRRTPHPQTAASRAKTAAAKRAQWADPTSGMRRSRPTFAGPGAIGWKGGVVRNKGRVMVYHPDHPRAWTTGYVYRAILVAEATLGRPVLRDEIVHHQNEVKDDDRPENLVVMTRGEHIRLHKKGVPRQRGAGGLFIAAPSPP